MERVSRKCTKKQTQCMQNNSQNWFDIRGYLDPKACERDSERENEGEQVRERKIANNGIEM